MSPVKRKIMTPDGCRRLDRLSRKLIAEDNVPAWTANSSLLFEIPSETSAKEHSSFRTMSSFPNPAVFFGVETVALFNNRSQIRDLRNQGRRGEMFCFVFLPKEAFCLRI